MKKVIVEVEEDKDAEFVEHMIDRLLGENPNMKDIDFRVYVDKERE